MSRLALLLGLGLAPGVACMSTQGWQHTDRRACDPQSPPILCLEAEADGPHELRVGERVLLPGECLVGPPDERGGRLAVVLHASGHEVARPRVHLKAGTRTAVRVEGRRVRVVDEQRCDGRVPAP
jgi:hypothetical protein